MTGVQTCALPIWPTGETLMPLLPSARVSMVVPLEKVEVFPVFPIAHFEVEAGDLGVLDPTVIVDEIVAEAGAQRLVLSQSGQRIVQRARHRLRLGLVRRVG